MTDSHMELRLQTHRWVKIIVTLHVMSGYKTIKVNIVDSKHMATVIVHVHILTPMWFTVKINWI